MKEKSCGLLIVLLLTAFLFPRSLFAAELKFAYVDVGKVFDEYEKTKKYDQVLQDEGKSKQEKRDALVYEVRRLRDEQALLSEEKKKETQKTIENKLKELDEFDQMAQRELGEKRNTIMKEVFTDIDNALKSYGQRKGYDVIFNEKALLYKDPSLDHTNDVLKELNDEYKKKK